MIIHIGKKYLKKKRKRMEKTMETMKKANIAVPESCVTKYTYIAAKMPNNAPIKTEKSLLGVYSTYPLPSLLSTF